jgi:hypothetical protein
MRGIGPVFDQFPVVVLTTLAILAMGPISMVSSMTPVTFLTITLVVVTMVIIAPLVIAGSLFAWVGLGYINPSRD